MCYSESYLLSSPTLKVISQQLRGTLTTAFERHFADEDFTDMDEHT